MSAIKIIQALGRKIAAKKSKTPEGITQIQPQIYAESEAGSIAATLQDAGIPFDRLDDFIKSEADLVRILNTITAMEKRNLAESIRSGIRNTETGKVFDMKGKEIPPGAKIMGGKATETEAEVLARMNKENKESVARIKNKKIVKDAIDNVSPGFVKGDRKYNAQLVAEELAEKKFGKEFYDLDQKQQMDLYDEALDGLSVDPDKFAQGGRAGFKDGPKLTDFLNIEAQGSKTGKQQIMGAPEGITKDSEFIEAIIKLDIPFNEKVNLLADYSYGKGRSRIEKDDQELFLGEGGYKDRNIGAEFNRGGDGFGGKIMYNLETGEPQLNLKFKKSFASGGRAGFFMGSANPKGLGLLKSLLNFFGKKSDVVKNPSDVLRVVNPKAFNKMLEDAKGKMMRQEGILATDAVKNYQTQMAKDRVDTVREMLERGKRFKTADDKIVAYKNEVKERFMKDLDMSEKEAEQAADRMATLAMDITKMPETPKITEEGLLQLENVLKNMETGGKKARDLNADGGRIGFKDGMTRRTFLKILGGVMSIPIVGKVLAPLKLTKGVSKVPIIKTDNVPGKPEWFDQLVNKVIIEGDDVTKKFATGERQSIHQKTLDDGSVVRVTEDVDDGAVRVEYESKESMFGEPVQMEYKKPLPDEGDPKPAAEFTTSESGMVSRADGPDDFVIEPEEVGGSSIRDLDSDVSKLKQYATGKGPTMKEIVEIKKRKDKVKRLNEGDPDETSQYISDRQGDYDPSPDDYASGGIARMLGE